MRTTGRMLAPLAILTAVTLAGCATSAPASTPTPTSPKPASSSSSSASPTPTAEAWVTHTTPDGTATFELPATWTAQEQPLPNDDPMARAAILILDQAGAQKLHYYPYLDGIGGACKLEYPVHVYDAVEVPIATYDAAPARMLYRVAETPEGVEGTMGLTQDDATDFAGCLFYNTLYTSSSLGLISFGTALQSPSDGNLTFASVDEAKAFASTPEYATLKRILTSLVLTG